MCPGCQLYKTVSAPLKGQRTPPPIRPTAAARWALLRMHFLTFPSAARRHTLQQWRATVEAALAASREAARQHQQKVRAAEALLFGSPAMKLLPPSALEREMKLRAASVARIDAFAGDRLEAAVRVVPALA